MTGDQKSRHCDKCNKSVHNIGELSAQEAESLLCHSTKSVCIRMQQTKDGAFKTKSGWMKRVALAGAAGLTLIPMVGCETAPQPLTGDMPVTTSPASQNPDSNYTMGEAIADPATLQGDIAPPQEEPIAIAGEVVPVPDEVMGKVVCPPEPTDPSNPN